MKLKHPVYLPEPPTIAELEDHARRMRLLWLVLMVMGCITLGVLVIVLLEYS